MEKSHWLPDHKVLRETQPDEENRGALKVLNARSEEVWLPKSQLVRYDGEWSVPDWLVNEKELSI